MDGKPVQEEDLIIYIVSMEHWSNTSLNQSMRTSLASGQNANRMKSVLDRPVLSLFLSIFRYITWYSPYAASWPKKKKKNLMISVPVFLSYLVSLQKHSRSLVLCCPIWLMVPLCLGWRWRGRCTHCLYRCCIPWSWTQFHCMGPTVF